jgi:short-subunit dehydrogenase
VDGRRVWVVGASSGIGAALARELGRRGARVAVSGRRVDRLSSVGEGLLVVPVDVTDAQAVRSAAAQVREGLDGLDTVVWCAGYWRQFDAASWDADVFAAHLDVNLAGLNHVMAATVPALAEQGFGQVVGVASVAGYRGLPGAEAYGATKAAQITMLEGMRGSLAPHGVDVLTVCPGFVRTEMTMGNRFPMPFMVEPEAAAAAIADGIERGAVHVVFPWQMAVLTKVARLVPPRAWGRLTAARGGQSARR